jgi:hypothetical protein
MNTLSIIKDILLAIAAIITAIVATKGLKIWRNQLKGTNEYKLSEEILEKTYKLEDAIRSARTPWISVGELSQRAQEGKISETETSQERDIRNEAYALWKRTEPMFEAVSELKIAKFKAKALWSEETATDINSMIHKAYELRNAQSAYFQMKINPSLTEEKLMDSYWRTMYEMPKDKDDFWKEVESIIQKIENRFRNYLK